MKGIMPIAITASDKGGVKLGPTATTATASSWCSDRQIDGTF